jgi:osmoprotectant transport system substrate-binding protein
MMVAMDSRAARRIATAAVALGVTVSLTGCIDSEAIVGTGAGKTITVGSQGGTQQDIVAQLYGQALAENGYTVEYNLGVGGRESFIPALQSGVVDLVVDTTGGLLYSANPTAYQRAPRDVAAALSEALAPLEVHALDAAHAESSNAFVVTAQFSKEKSVSSIGDLAYLAGSLTFGGSEGFEDERYGRAGLLTAYNVRGFDFHPVQGDGPAAVSELLTGGVDVAVLPSTSPSINRNNLVVLADPKNLLTAQNLVPVVGADAYTGDVARITELVSDELTTEELRALNERSTAQGNPSPERIARLWLATKGIVD